MRHRGPAERISHDARLQEIRNRFANSHQRSGSVYRRQPTIGARRHRDGADCCQAAGRQSQAGAIHRPGQRRQPCSRVQRQPTPQQRTRREIRSQREVYARRQRCAGGDTRRVPGATPEAGDSSYCVAGRVGRPDCSTYEAGKSGWPASVAPWPCGVALSCSLRGLPCGLLGRCCAL